MNDRPSDGIARIRAQILWDRMIAVVEEQAQTLMRTAFSTSVREAGDLSAGVFDRRGRMVAQAVTGTPGHVNSMANAMGFFLARYPIDAMKPGDHFITNDPWQTSGHLHDITVVSPAFHKGRAVALFACTIHVVDIGGRGFGPDGRQVYEEGMRIPVMPLARAGTLNEDLLGMVRANVREADQVVGDMISCATSNDEGGRVLVGMLGEYCLDDIEDLSDTIVGTSRDGMLKRIRDMQHGTWHNALRVDGYERPVDLVAALTVSDAGIHVDFTGTSPASQYGINVVLNYTHAYTSFGVNCILGGDIPNNHGSLSVITVSAPEGCILNAQHPAPVAMRHGIGHALPDLVFGCLEQVVPGRVPAQSSAALWNPQMTGGAFAVDADAAGVATHNLRDFTVLSFHAGGMGARPDKDGLSATAFPSGVRTMPVEVTESISPLVFWRKELVTDTGGAGAARGGLGHRLIIGTSDSSPFGIQLTADRIDNPPKGLAGGRDGGAAEARLASGKPLRPKGNQTVPAGDSALLQLAGGGGYGDPRRREPRLIAADLRQERISPAAARDVYGAVIGSDGQVDIAATIATRR